MADRKKRFRKNPSLGMGDWRFFISEPGTISIEDLPPGWGLLHVVNGRVRKVHGWPKGNCCWGNPEDKPFIGNKQVECDYMLSALRRMELRGHLNEIYDGVIVNKKEGNAYTYLLHQQSIVNLQSMLRCHLTHALELVICLVQNAVLEILQKKKQCVDGLVIMCAAIADTTTLKTHLESVVKTSLSKLIKNAKATKKANLLFIYENNVTNIRIEELKEHQAA
ncbi:TPA: hypothetical protein ACV70J_003783 [Escherichia coli]